MTKEIAKMFEILDVCKKTFKDSLKQYKFEDREYALSHGGMTALEMFEVAMKSKGITRD